MNKKESRPCFHLLSKYDQINVNLNRNHTKEVENLINEEEIDKNRKTNGKHTIKSVGAHVKIC